MTFGTSLRDRSRFSYRSFKPFLDDDRYRPVTVTLTFLASVTHSPSPFHHRDTPVPNRPSPSLTVPHRPSPSLTVPHRPSPSFTVLHRPSPSFTVLHRPSPSFTVLHRPSPSFTVLNSPSPSLDVQHRSLTSNTVPRRPTPFVQPLFNSLSSFIMVKDNFLNFYHLLRLFFNHFSSK
jgi:hypothetical protein